MSRPAFTICICPDSRLLRDRLDELLGASPAGRSGASDGPVWQRHVFWADEGLSDAFWEHLTLQGLFAVPKALILRNAHILPADSLKRLSPVLAGLASRGGSDTVWPLICLEVAFDKGKAKVPAHIPRLSFWRAAEAKGWIDELPGLTAQSLPAYVRAEAARRCLALSPQEMRQLAASLPPDAALAASELDKLALLADAQGRLPAGAIDTADHGRDMGIFELMRIAQQGGDTPAAWRRILEDRLSGENMVFAFIAILLREARLLWQALAGGFPSYLPPQAAVQKQAAARMLGFAGVARLWEMALAAEKGIKTGERSPEQAFEMLTADLFRLFGHGRGV